MRVALISCVKTKRNIASKAKDLYTSCLFKMNYAYAKKTCDKVYILSAKHGLLNENNVIEPYEQTLNKMNLADRQAWATKVIKQLEKETDLQKDQFVILAGERYRENILLHIKNHEIPLKGLSFGKQLQKLKEMIK